MIVKKHGEWLASKVASELVMMNVETGDYIGLSKVGRRIWEIIDTSCEVDVLCDQLSMEYEIAPETCRLEVDAFLNELATHGAVALEP